ncbi:MAG: hypothetical protein ACREQX_17910, partial [Candidatus Binataceae bacterium]
EDVRRAVAVMTRGALSVQFWGGALALGAVVPLVLLGLAQMGGTFTLTIAAAVAALAGLLIFELVWIKAGQAVALS